MPMPILDPDVYVDAWLADPSHKLPLPDKGGRLFFVEGEKVDRYHPFYAALLADGSLVREKPDAPAIEAAPEPQAEAGAPAVEPVPAPATAS